MPECLEVFGQQRKLSNFSCKSCGFVDVCGPSSIRVASLLKSIVLLIVKKARYNRVW